MYLSFYPWLKLRGLRALVGVREGGQSDGVASVTVGWSN